MKSKLLMTGVVALLVGTSPAHAAMIAGWDFSQYALDGALSTDGENFTNVLPANYSDFDPSFGAGAQSAPYGTMFLNGQNGSFNTPLDFTDPFVPSAANPGSLASNINGPQDGSPAGDAPFDSLSILQAEGQQYANFLTMVANGAVSVVFGSDLGPLAIGSDYQLVLAGRVAQTSQVAVEFSTDGSSYSLLQNLNLTSIDSTFTVDAPTGPQTQHAFFRLTFPGTGEFIDNLQINAGQITVVPEPGTALLLGTGIAGLAHAGRRRRV